MKNVKDWIAILEEYSKCGICDSENVYPVITPYPYEYTSKTFKDANSKRGIMITCNICGAVSSISAEKIES